MESGDKTPLLVSERGHRSSQIIQPADDRQFQVTEYLLIATLLTAHGYLLARESRRRLQRRLDPLVFLLVSYIIHYDFGLLLEMLSPLSGDGLFALVQRNNLAGAVGFLTLLFAPYCVLLGYRWGIAAVLARPDVRSAVGVRFRRVALVWLCMGAVSLAWALVGLGYLREGTQVWSARAQIGADWGPFIVFVYVPLHILAFFLSTEESQGPRGLAFAVFLAGCAVCAVAPTGQRTNVLLAPLMILLFWRRASLRRLAVGGGILLVIAAVLLPLFKWQYEQQIESTRELLLGTLQADIGRTSSLAYSLERAQWVGTDVLPYPMAGYVYSVLFFVPRSIAPLKGFATATYVTAEMVNQLPDETGWLIGLGATEELMLNGGLILVLPGLVGYGLLFGMGHQYSRERRQYDIPLCLAALWLFAYNLPAILLLFGVMALAGALMARIRQRIVSVETLLVRSHSGDSTKRARGRNPPTVADRWSNSPKYRSRDAAYRGSHRVTK